jgi:hypothetical protein
MLVEISMLKIFKSRFHKQVFDLSPSLDNNKTGNMTEESEDVYLKFPAYSLKVFFAVLKVIYNKKNHLFIKPYLRDMTQKDLFLETISKNILLIGIIGISGMEYKAWGNINAILGGIIAGCIARLIHFLYSSLQAKQEILLIHISSQDKLVINVETEVMRRLNAHRNMRRVLGYFIMFLYYLGNMYYSIKYVVIFSSSTTLIWFLACLIGIGMVIFIIEPLKVYLEIEAINYLKQGGSKGIEAICKLFASEEVLTTFE